LLDGGQLLTQSLAICEYLDEAYPDTPALLPPTVLPARVRALALSICADIHPLHNSRVLKYLEAELGQGDAQKTRWICHWIATGFAALEQQLASSRHAMPSGIARPAGCLPGAAGVCCAAFRAGSDSVSHIVRIDAAWPVCRPLRCASGTASGCRIGILTSRPDRLLHAGPKREIQSA
jgi:maleylacetoacetate isomerase/maleylpyruvate isomerase